MLAWFSVPKQCLKNVQFYVWCGPVTREMTTGTGPQQNIVRAPAKITRLIMFHLGCQIKILVFLVLKIEKDQMATLCSMKAGV